MGMGRFEYKLVEASAFSGRPVETSLNKLGEHGWELVTIQELKGTTYYIFKRELQTSQPQQQVDV
jgi:hypothetical protein